MYIVNKLEQLNNLVAYFTTNHPQTIGITREDFTLQEVQEDFIDHQIATILKIKNNTKIILLPRQNSQVYSNILYKHAIRLIRKNESAELNDLLVSHPPLVAQTNDSRWSLTVWAVLYCSIETLKILKQHKADFDQATIFCSEDKLPLDIFSYISTRPKIEKYLKFLDSLFQHFSEDKQQILGNIYAYHVSKLSGMNALTNPLKILTALETRFRIKLEPAKIKCRKSGREFLHAAVSYPNRTRKLLECNPEIVRFGIEVGCDVNGTDHEGRTPLHLICDYHYAHEDAANIAELLCQNGANVVAKDNNGRTPLDYLSDIDIHLMPQGEMRTQHIQLKRFLKKIAQEKLTHRKRSAPDDMDDQDITNSKVLNNGSREADSGTHSYSLRLG